MSTAGTRKQVRSQNLRLEMFTSCDICGNILSLDQAQQLLFEELTLGIELRWLDAALEQQDQVDPLKLRNRMESALAPGRYSAVHPHHYLQRLLGKLQFDHYTTDPWDKDAHLVAKAFMRQAESMKGCPATRNSPNNCILEAAKYLLHHHRARGDHSRSVANSVATRVLTEDLWHILRLLGLRLAQEVVCYGRDGRAHFDCTIVLLWDMFWLSSRRFS